MNLRKQNVDTTDKEKELQKINKQRKELVKLTEPIIEHLRNEQAQKQKKCVETAPTPPKPESKYKLFFNGGAVPKAVADEEGALDAAGQLKNNFSTEQDVS